MKRICISFSLLNLILLNIFCVVNLIYIEHLNIYFICNYTFDIIINCITLLYNCIIYNLQNNDST